MEEKEEVEEVEEEKEEEGTRWMWRRGGGGGVGEGGRGVRRGGVGSRRGRGGGRGGGRGVRRDGGGRSREEVEEEQTACWETTRGSNQQQVPLIPKPPADELPCSQRRGASASQEQEMKSHTTAWRRRGSLGGSAGAR